MSEELFFLQKYKKKNNYVILTQIGMLKITHD